jgi:16S rRNA (uracil1498-N3)-methyltransferase
VSDRFFHDGPLGPGDVTLDGSEAHHLAVVRRIGPGDAVTLFNGDGREYPARVVEAGKRRVIVQVVRADEPKRELGFTLHVAAALPKGDRGDFLVEKLTELGVTDFTPLVTDRAIVKPMDDKVDKLRRAVIEASKQCGRNVLMRVHAGAPWLAWCGLQAGRRLLADPAAARGAAPAPGSALVAIGPEGGFTDAELEAGRDAGWESISLGARVLRVETAAVVAAALLGRVG